MSYGRRLTDREYEAAIVSLHKHAPPMPSKSEDRERRHKEFMLMVDHRLGVDFPEHLRAALWSVHQELEKKRLRLAARSLVGKLPFNFLAHRAHSLADLMVNEYAKVIGRKDAERFFGLSQGEPPSLPIDKSQ